METNQQRDDEIEIDLVEVFRLLVSKLGIIILSGMIFAFLAIIGTKLFITPKYQSITKMYVLAQQNSDTVTNSDLQTSTLLTKDYAELITSRTVAESVIANLRLDLKYDELIDKIEVGTTSDTRIITIKVIDEDPYVARDIANAVRDTAAEHIKSVMNIEAVNVVDAANIPDQKCSPSVSKNGLLAGMLGCFLAVVILLIQYLSNDTIKVSEDVEHYLGLSTLGVIPMEKTDGKKKKKAKKSVRRK
ncbi:Wzz/FepE/Etk N-terminal domain-containing protein [bacterium]|nr:Wzz/FepE/Etk N-terminal domain-containing protein [bacterium]MDY3021895.1 Wzz/FepE/Etk N-terminal domain-containing protein [Oliverpabstia sp.]